jgi:hypothetical protein
MKECKNRKKVLVISLVMLVELQKMVDGGVMTINILYSLLCCHYWQHEITERKSGMIFVTEFIKNLFNCFISYEPVLHTDKQT